MFTNNILLLAGERGVINTQLNTNMAAAVDISGDGLTVVAGNRQYDTPNTNGGLIEVYTFANEVWSLETPFAFCNGNANEQNGLSVALSYNGNTLLFTSDTGFYIYSRSGTYWSEEYSLVGSDLNEYKRYSSISGDGKRALMQYSDTVFRLVTKNTDWINGPYYALTDLGVSIKGLCISKDGSKCFVLTTSDVKVYNTSGMSNGSSADYTISVTGTSISCNESGSQFVVSGAKTYTLSGGSYSLTHTTTESCGVATISGDGQYMIARFNSGVNVYAKNGDGWSLVDYQPASSSGYDAAISSSALKTNYTGDVTIIGGATSSTGIESGYVLQKVFV